MQYTRRFDLRNPLRHSGPRFCVHVVDGPGEATPGRLRTLRFDYNCEAADWLKIEWVTSGGRRVGIDSIDLAGRAQKAGSFFLSEAFDADPDPEIRTEGKRLFEDWAKRVEDKQKVESFPDEWMPKRVLEARKAAKEKAKPYKVPARKKGGAA